MAKDERTASPGATLEALFREPPVPGLVSPYLFGSHAEGRSHRESDIDVAVLLRHAAHPTARERFEVRLRLSSWLAERAEP